MQQERKRGHIWISTAEALVGHLRDLVSAGPIRFWGESLSPKLLNTPQYLLVFVSIMTGRFSQTCHTPLGSLYSTVIKQAVPPIDPSPTHSLDAAKRGGIYIH